MNCILRKGDKRILGVGTEGEICIMLAEVCVYILTMHFAFAKT